MQYYTFRFDVDNKETGRAYPQAVFNNSKKLEPNPVLLANMAGKGTYPPNNLLPFDYFEELTRRIADIRTSEKRFYRKITDIYATSTDYDPTSEDSILFFKTVQNKMLWAITNKTAAELIVERANAEAPALA